MKRIALIVALAIAALTSACASYTPPAEKWPYCKGCYDGGS